LRKQRCWQMAKCNEKAARTREGGSQEIRRVAAEMAPPPFNTHLGVGY
jgi:hypothetical protein